MLLSSAAINENEHRWFVGIIRTSVDHIEKVTVSNSGS